MLVKEALVFEGTFHKTPVLPYLMPHGGSLAENGHLQTITASASHENVSIERSMVKTRGYLHATMGSYHTVPGDPTKITTYLNPASGYEYDYFS